MASLLIEVGQIAVFAAIAAIVLFGWRVMIAASDSVRERLRLAARLLALTPEEAGAEERSAEPGEAFVGQPNGLPVRLAVGSKLVWTYPGMMVPLHSVQALVRFPSALGLRFKMVRAEGVFERTLDHPDKDFNRSCAVAAGAADSVLSLLDDAELRSAIAAFLKEGGGCAWLDEQGAQLLVVDADRNGATRIVERVRQAEAVVRALHERARRLGLAGGDQ